MNFDTMHPAWLIGASVLLSLVPVMVGICTSYLKVSVVLGMLRSGIGAQQVPSNLLVMALSTALSLFIMGPIAQHSYEKLQRVSVDLKGVPTQQTLATLEPAWSPWRAFLEKHTGARELSALTSLDPHKESAETTTAPITTDTPVSLRVLFTAFMLTELKEAFAMGFVLLLPFLVIDIIIANILGGMGMTMVSPTLISLPLKLLLFVVSDGWLLLSRSLILSYQ